MPIKVACSCGRSFAAPDHLAGRAVKCPNCSQPLKIPAAQPQQPAAPATGGLADLLAEEGLATKAGTGPQCPSCGAAMPEHGFLCVQCGYNVQAGRKVQTFNELEQNASRDAQQLLAKAREELKKSPQQFTAQEMGAGASAYLTVVILLVATVVIIGTSVAVLYFFGDEAALLATISGILMYVVGRIWLIVVAFFEETSCGVFCLLCEPYCLYYAISRFRSVAVPSFMFLTGYVFVSIGKFVM